MTAENIPTPAAPDTIVLIHGLWVTPRSWEQWIERYEGRVTACSRRIPRP